MRSNIRRWLGLEFGEILESGGGDDLRVDCPFCPRRDKGKHLYVSTRQPVVHCFRCHWKGTHYDLVREVSGAETVAEIYTILTSRRANVSGFETAVDRLRHYRTATLSPVRVKSDKGMPSWFKSFHDAGTLDWYTRPIFEYTMGRFTPEEVLHFNIGFCADPENDLLMYRVIIPIERGYWQGRTIFPETEYTPKYVNPEEPIEDRVFNFPALSRARTLYVAEGAISAAALGEDAIATLGMEITGEQLARIGKAKAGRVVLTVEDGLHWADVVGDAADYLHRQGKAVTIRTYAKGDPADAGEFTEIPYTLRDIVESKLFPA